MAGKFVTPSEHVAIDPGLIERRQGSRVKKPSIKLKGFQQN